MLNKVYNFENEVGLTISFVNYSIILHSLDTFFRNKCAERSTHIVSIRKNQIVEREIEDTVVQYFPVLFLFCASLDMCAALPFYFPNATFSFVVKLDIKRSVFYLSGFCTVFLRAAVLCFKTIVSAAKLNSNFIMNR